MKTMITHTSTEQLFVEVRKHLRKIDRAEKVSPLKIINFEDPGDLLKILSMDNYAIVKEVRKGPKTYKELVKSTHKDRSSVVRAVKRLVEIGLVQVEEVTNSGHGRHKFVTSTGNGELVLQARL